MTEKLVAVALVPAWCACTAGFVFWAGVGLATRWVRVPGLPRP